MRSVSGSGRLGSRRHLRVLRWRLGLWERFRGLLRCSRRRECSGVQGPTRHIGSPQSSLVHRKGCVSEVNSLLFEWAIHPMRRQGGLSWLWRSWKWPGWLAGVCDVGMKWNRGFLGFCSRPLSRVHTLGKVLSATPFFTRATPSSIPTLLVSVPVPGAPGRVWRNGTWNRPASSNSPIQTASGALSAEVGSVQTDGEASLQPPTLEFPVRGPSQCLFGTRTANFEMHSARKASPTRHLARLDEQRMLPVAACLHRHIE